MPLRKVLLNGFGVLVGCFLPFGGGAYEPINEQRALTSWLTA